MGASFSSQAEEPTVKQVRDPKQRAMAMYLKEESTIDEVWKVFSVEVKSIVNDVESK